MHAVVIGAGFGGLSAAIRLRAKGYEVTVLEANEQAGGRAAVWRQDGFTFDAGPTVITAPYLLHELWDLVGRDHRDYFELLPVDPFYRVDFADGSTFDYVGEEDRIVDQIRAMSPDDVDGYRKLAAHAEQIFDKGYTELADVPFDTVGEMLRVVPDLVKLENYKTVYQLVAKYIQDERLRQVFTFQPLLVGGNPFQTTSIYMLIHWLERKWGVWFAKGGTTSLVDAMTRLLGELGVDVRLNAPVERILVENGRTTGVVVNGQTLACDIVVSNADPSTTYTKLIEKRHRFRNSDLRVKLTKQSMSLFVTYFGTDRIYDDVRHHTIVLGPRYKGLLHDIFNRKVLADDHSLYLHRPTVTDRSLAPEGCDAFYVLSPVPNLEGGQDWEDLHEAYEDRILESLEQRGLPNLRDHIVTKKSVDPRYFNDRLRSTSGAAFGPEPIFRQSAWFRYHNRSPDIEGLYFVGAGTHPGAGVPGVLCSSKVLDRVVPTPIVAVALPQAKVGAA